MFVRNFGGNQGMYQVTHTNSNDLERLIRLSAEQNQRTMALLASENASHIKRQTSSQQSDNTLPSLGHLSLSQKMTAVTSMVNQIPNFTTVPTTKPTSINFSNINVNDNVRQGLGWRPPTGDLIDNIVEKQIEAQRSLPSSNPNNNPLLARLHNGQVSNFNPTIPNTNLQTNLVRLVQPNFQSIYHYHAPSLEPKVTPNLKAGYTQIAVDQMISHLTQINPNSITHFTTPALYKFKEFNVNQVSHPREFHQYTGPSHYTPTYIPTVTEQPRVTVQPAVIISHPAHTTTYTTTTTSQTSTSTTPTSVTPVSVPSTTSTTSTPTIGSMSWMTWTILLAGVILVFYMVSKK